MTWVILGTCPSLINCQPPAAHVEEDTQQADLIDDLPSLPPFSCRFWNKRQRETRCVNGGNTRRWSTEQGRQGRVQLRSLAYARKVGLVDIEVVAKRYGDDLLDISFGESFLNLREAHKLLESIPTSSWRHRLNKQGELNFVAEDNSVDFMEIFSTELIHHMQYLCSRTHKRNIEILILLGTL